MNDKELLTTILKELVSAKVQSQTAFAMVTALRQTLAARSPDFDKEYVARMETLLQSIPSEMNPETTLKALQAIVQSAVDTEGQS
jgi:hypothetical protein